MSYNYEEIIKMLEQNQQQQMNMIAESNKYIQARFENIYSNFQQRMTQIENELQNISARSSAQAQQISSAFDVLNSKINTIYKNPNNYPQLQNINCFCAPRYQNNKSNSFVESVVKDSVKSILCNFAKIYLSEDEKRDFDLCNDILDAFDISLTLHDPNKTKLDKGYALIKASELLNKYYPFN